MRLRYWILTALAAFLPCWHLHAAWELSIVIQNLGSSGSFTSSNMIIGEHPDASDGYDAGYDLRYSFPPMSNQYVATYIVHDDWGANNGNYLTDIRSQIPGDKLWPCQIRAHNPYSANFTLSWSLPNGFPDYYQPTLILASASIDMRTQSEYAFSSSYTFTDYSIALEYNDALPTQNQALPTLSFSDNQIQSLTLCDYFSSGDGGLEYTCVPNLELVQELEAGPEGMLWHIYPRPGWRGETAADLRVYGSQGDSLSAFLSVIRDSTNTPPQWEGALELQLIQNQEYVLSWEGLIYDADRDIVSVAINAGEHFSAAYSDSLAQATLIPQPAFKGETAIFLLLSDGSSPLQRINIPVQVLPSEPQCPQGMILQILPDHTLDLSWTAVTADISGLPVNQICYRVSLYAEPDATGIIFQQETSDTRIILPLSQPRAFIRIIAINAED